MKQLQIMNISGVDCYEKDGIAYLKVENIAKGLGFTEFKNGKEYVMWRRIDGFLENLGFGTSAERPEFIPENIFYRLVMKARNEMAERFQAKVANEIIPSIRKHGDYLTKNVLEQVLTSPDFWIWLATKLKEEQVQNQRLTAACQRMKPKEIFADAVGASHTSILIGIWQS